MQDKTTAQDQIASGTNEKITSGTNPSYWTTSVQTLPAYAPLNLNISTDVVIVGGGIAGLTTAYCLQQSGKRVAVVEDGYIGSGETGRTSAHLASALDDGFVNLERLFGEEKTKLIIGSHQAAIDFVEKTVREEKIDCDFSRVNGYLFLHPNDSVTSLTDEKEAAQRAGLKVHALDYIPGLKNQKASCLMFENQAQFHPLKYISALAQIIVQRGGQIYTGSHAKEINSKGIVTDKGYSISAQHVVVCTNTPVNNKFAIHLKQYPYRTYIIGCRVKKGSVPNALWWDTGDYKKNADLPPYHYVRLTRLDEEYDLLLCGGEDHVTGQSYMDDMPEEKHYDLLLEWAREHFPVEEVVYHWSGQIMEPMDSIGFIGRNPHDEENVFICTGDSGNGLTNGTLAGLLITDLINGKPNEWEKVYDPSRFKFFKAGKTFLKEVVGNTVNYYKHKPGREELAVVRKMANDEARVITLDRKKYGVYKDPAGELHMVSATCTHLGCIINWNTDEKTWDCPCHGSRFTHLGKVINGPANQNLEYKKPGELEEENLAAE